MRLVSSARLRLLASAGLLLAALPVLGQDAPESILPPGFGDPEPARPSRPAAPKPASPKPSGGEPASPRLDLDIDGDTSVSGGGSGGASVSRSAPVAAADGVTEEEADELLDAPMMPDLPPSARRPVEMAGVIGPEAQGFSLEAFGDADGKALATVLQGIRAPIASRWASITLRRALLSRALAPKGIDPADWAAERVWLLVRMGEADPARMLAQAVDADRQTARMRDMALQAALASSDPASACPAADHAPGAYKEAQWMLARAMCNAFAGESAQASALVDSVRDKGLARNIDTLLAEKVLGAAGNTRRSVKVQWDGVKKLTIWRYGLATATGVELPQGLLPSDPARLRAWRARAPLRTAESRLDDADFAAGLGVFSNSAMVDLYSAAHDESDPAERSGKRFNDLRKAYAGASSADRLEAMEALWGNEAADTLAGYGRMVLTARAAALIDPAGGAAQADRLITSMLTAGLVGQAARWRDTVSSGSVSWAQLVLAVPGMVRSLDQGDVTGLDEGSSGKRAQFFLAGAAGLGLMGNAATGAAESLEIRLTQEDAWTRMIDRAAAAGEQGSVVLLVGLGLQGRRWADVPPQYLYRAVAALSKVGMASEARLIAAEAVARS